jgi:adenosine deaminase
MKNQNTATDGNLESVKLCELHTHLGASVSGHILWEIAHESGLRLPVKDYWEFLDHMSVKGSESHNNYLNRFQLTQAIQSSPHAVELSVYHAIGEAFRTYNITTIEIRFNPMKRSRDQLYDMDAVIMSACIGLKRACLVYPVKAGIILETDRLFDPSASMIIAQKAVKYQGDGVVGFDISGPSPDGFSFKQHMDAFHLAKDAGLGITLHAGEVLGSKEMWEAINLIRPHRIGHGIQCVKDVRLMQEIVECDIVLEVCPTSNLHTGVIKDIEALDHTINTLLHNNVKFCINSDGPFFLNTSVRDEMILLQEEKIISPTTALELIQKAHTYTFIK